MVQEYFRPREANADAIIYAHNTFPFGRREQLPTVSIVLRNMALSTATLLGSLGSLVLTTLVFLPLGVYGSFARRWASRGGGAGARKKVIWITGARYKQA